MPDRDNGSMEIINELQRLGYLTSREAQDSLSDDERIELQELLKKDKRYEEWKVSLQQPGAWKQLITDYKMANADTETVLQAVMGNRKSIQPAHRVHFLKTTWFRYAAAIILIFGIGAYLWNNNLKVKTENSKTAKTDSSNEILPGGQKALLTLADGSTIILDSAANGQLATQGNSTIIKKDGIITYKSEGLSSPFEKGGRSDARGEGTAGGFNNTMSTPRGGQYQLTLADGTRVWLNAASSITYPTAFTGNKREVSITGEAYFEVAQNKSQPFIVSVVSASSSSGKSLPARRQGGSSDMSGNEDSRGIYQITVLGTEFNVHAYNEEPSKTSLIEGSVKINDRILQPGQAFINGKIIATNIEQDIAWKNGYFWLKNKSVSEIMRELSRWYDIDVVYENGIPNEKLTGKIGRNLNLSQVLNGLQKLGIKTRMENNRRVVIMP